jgi:hypothetical protein
MYAKEGKTTCNRVLIPLFAFGAFAVEILYFVVLRAG